MTRKFKIGDRVKIISEDQSADQHLVGMIGTIKDFSENNVAYVDFGKKIEQKHNKIDDTTHQFFDSELELIKKGKEKPIKPENPIRFMVYGTGCNNKSELFKDESRAKEHLKECSKDSDWTGDILMYEMKPIFQAEEKTIVKAITKPKTKRTKPKK